MQHCIQNVLCSIDKWQPPQNEKNVVYCFECPPTHKKYIGKTKRKVVTRGREHKCAVKVQNLCHSDIMAHKEHCDAVLDWDNPKILASFQKTNKRALNYDLQIRASLMVQAKDSMRTMATLSKRTSGARSSITCEHELVGGVAFLSFYFLRLFGLHAHPFLHPLHLCHPRPFLITPLILSQPLMMIIVKKIQIFGNSVVIICTCDTPLKKPSTHML